jgi:hypothetical protein
MARKHGYLATMGLRFLANPDAGSSPTLVMTP